MTFVARYRAPRLLIGFAPAAALLVALTLAGIVPAAAALSLAGVLFAGLWWSSARTVPSVEAPRQSVDTAAPAVPQEILDYLPDPVIVLNGDRRIIAVNSAARDVLGVVQLGRDLALSLRHPAVLAAVEAIFSGAASISEEMTLPAPTPRTFTLHAGSLSDAGDTTRPRAVLVLRDETRAKRAEKSRADFVANASHELRSPLSAMIGFIETLLGPASDDPAARERFLGIMHGESLRMARLVEDLMSLSRVEINEHIPPKGTVDIGEILNRVAEALAVRCEGREMTINVEVPDDLPPVRGDDDQLTQVFHNLINNAIKYGRSGTSIHVKAETVTGQPRSGQTGVLVSVTDQGEGIPELHLPRLTERFYRVDDSRSRQLGGTGLGLAIVKHIVNRHRGRLTIESRVGVGSTFSVFLRAAGPSKSQQG